MKTGMWVVQESVVVESSFADFTFCLERLLGVLTPAAMDALGARPASMEGSLLDVHGELLLFNIEDPGPGIRRYYIGWPAFCDILARVDVGALLYMPLRLLVYVGADGRVRVEHELAASQLGACDDASVRKMADALDARMRELIRRADAGSA